MYENTELAGLDRDQLEREAERQARNMERMHYAGTDLTTLPLPYGLRVSGQTPRTQTNRLCDSAWWFDRLRVLAARHREHLRIRDRVVGAGGDPYISAEGLEEHQIKKSLTELWARDRFAKDQATGRLCMLSDLMAKQVEQRYAELVTTMKGLDDKGEAEGAVAVFLTNSLPPGYHPNPSHGRSSWNGSSIVEACEELSRIENAFLTDVRREIPGLFGVRVREPHKDGCPHDHLLFYPQEAERHILRRLQDKHFPWQTQQPNRFQILHSARGSTYVTKYIAKHTLGIEGESDSNARVNAWRSTHGVRSFAFIGLPRGTREMWRTLRRLEELAEADSSEADRALQAAAKAGEFYRFLVLLETTEVQLIREDVVGTYGDTNSRPVGVVTSFGVFIELPRFEIVTVVELWRIGQEGGAGRSLPLYAPSPPHPDDPGSGLS